MEESINNKLLKALEEPEEVRDEFYHFGMHVANKLRKLPAPTADYIISRFSNLIYEVTYPQFQSLG